MFAFLFWRAFVVNISVWGQLGMFLIVFTLKCYLILLTDYGPTIGPPGGGASFLKGRAPHGCLIVGVDLLLSRCRSLLLAAQ